MELYGRYGPKKGNDPRIGDPCPVCHVPFKAGDYTTLVALGPNNNEDRAKCAAGRPFTNVALEVHWLCSEHGARATRAPGEPDQKASGEIPVDYPGERVPTPEEVAKIRTRDRPCLIGESGTSAKADRRALLALIDARAREAAGIKAPPYGGKRSLAEYGDRCSWLKSRLAPYAPAQAGSPQQPEEEGGES